MLKIKLTRTGKKNQSRYRIIVQEARTKRDGSYIEKLGYYNPNTDPNTVKINKKRLNYWLNQGAQPTKTVNRLIENYD